MVKTDIKAEIISIGDELLIGQVVNTNASWMGNIMNLNGFSIHRITSISDDKDEICKALDYALKESHIILITGGLGPTNDDITKKTLATYFNTPLVFNDEVLQNIKAFFTSRNKVFTEAHKEQTMVPENCTVIGNEVGTAPGMLFEVDDKIVVSMPGVPAEMKVLMNKHVLPIIKKKYNPQIIKHKTILTNGISESEMADLIKDWESNLPAHIALAYLPSPGLLRLRLSGVSNNKAELTAEINEQVHKLQQIIHPYIFGYDNDKLEEIVGKLLVEKQATVATAESYTGGKIATILTSISGASQYFKGTVVAYDNEVKEHILNVNKQDLINHGAVSKTVAEQMAENVRRRLKTDFAIATTGIAGPTGGTPQKPVGTAWIAIASEKEVHAKLFSLGSHRDKIVDQSVRIALNMLRKHLLENY